MMNQIYYVLFVIITSEVLSVTIDKRCPCVEAQLCFVKKTNFQTFQAFQAATSSCPDSYVRCCSQEMMLLSLIELTNEKQEDARRRARQQNLNANQLPCIKPFQCSEIYGTQAFHFIHINPQKLCPNTDEVRCVVKKLDEETSLPCVHHKQCKQIYGTKPDHVRIYGFMTACLNPSFVRCVDLVNSDLVTSTSSSISSDFDFDEDNIISGSTPDLMSIVVTSSSQLVTTRSTTSKPTFVTFSPGVVPDLESIVVTSSPESSSNFPLIPIQTTTQSTLFPPFEPGVTPDLDSVVICDEICREALKNQDKLIGREESGQILVSNSNQGPAFTIIGPKPVYYQVSNVQGPVIVRDDANEREQLKVYLRLARDRLKHYIEGK